MAAKPMQSPLMAATMGLSSSSSRLTKRRLIIGSCTSPSSSTSPPGRSDIALTLERFAAGDSDGAMTEMRSIMDTVYRVYLSRAKSFEPGVPR